MSDHQLGHEQRTMTKKLGRAEILACAAIAISLMAWIWPAVTNRSATLLERESPQSESPESPPPEPIPIDGLTLDDLSAGSARVAETTFQSVVRVEVSFKGRTPPSDDLEIYFGRMPQETVGSGIIVHSDGLVLTNYHVVRGAESLSVMTFDGARHAATLIGHDPLTDLALLKVTELKLPALSWADSDRVASGHFVWAIGSPYGLDQSISMGVISSTDRPTMLDSPFQDFFQTDASINPGNSGGPLVDSRGRLIGINTAITGETFAGISFALPGNTAKRVYEQLRDRGEVPRGWIGLHLGTVTQARAAVAGLDRPMGAYVESLASGTEVPAQAAGVRVADICTSFQGQPVTGPLGLIRQIANHPVGTTARLNIVRAGEAIELSVQVQLRP